MLNFLKYIMNYFKEDIPFDGYNPPPKNILMPKKNKLTEVSGSVNI